MWGDSVQPLPALRVRLHVRRGLSDAQIGAVASLSLAAQFAWAFSPARSSTNTGGALLMLTFGLLSWTIPCALWTLAKGYWYFAAAAALNGMWR
jgi:hypothetical protein